MNKFHVRPRGRPFPFDRNSRVVIEKNVVRFTRHFWMAISTGNWLLRIAHVLTFAPDDTMSRHYQCHRGSSKPLSLFRRNPTPIARESLAFVSYVRRTVRLPPFTRHSSDCGDSHDLKAAVSAASAEAAADGANEFNNPELPALQRKFQK